MATKLVGFLQNCEIATPAGKRKFRKGEVITLPEEFLAILHEKVPGAVANLTPSHLTILVKNVLENMAVRRALFRPRTSPPRGQ